MSIKMCGKGATVEIKVHSSFCFRRIDNCAFNMNQTTKDKTAILREKRHALFFKGMSSRQFEGVYVYTMTCGYQSMNTEDQSTKQPTPRELLQTTISDTKAIAVGCTSVSASHHATLQRLALLLTPLCHSSMQCSVIPSCSTSVF